MRKLFSIFTFILFFQQQSSSQSTGIINRAATSSAGQLILDPNSDGYTSKTSSGFGTNDVTNSEISFTSVPTYSTEPYGDLRRGPNHLYSDFVPDANGNGVYMTYSGGNLIFRFRVGSIMPGSKGYSILIDTDDKFGATGANADPNYLAATTGTNGNPGFEIEVVLETNSRIAIYNVDGTSTPTLVKSYTNWQDMSQISVAGTFDNGDPDFFIDFYIPFSDLTASPFNLTTSTPLRFSATTVMSPQAAIGGPKSDIYGLSDNGYTSTNDEYSAYINAQPTVTMSGLSGGFGGMCTASPTLNSPIATGTVNISGTWTKSSLSGAVSTATITVYKNGTSVGIVSNVSSGATWTLNNVSIANGDVITAKAQGSGESMCLVSNSVTAQGCNTSNIPSTTGLAISCTSNRGLEGTFVTGNQVKVYFIDPITLSTSQLAGPSANSPTFGYSGTNWFYNGTNYNGSQIPSACSGGAPDMNNGSYYVTTNVAGSNCESAPVFGCLGLTNTTAPTISQTALYNSTTQISGTATAGAQVTLWINGQLKSTTTATGGNYSFSGLSLTVGDVVDIRAITTGNCMSNSVSMTVVCYTTPPIITADNNNQITAGSPITGTSGEAVGTTIKVYTSGNTLIATTTVQANGTWSTGNAGTTPSTYNAVNGTSYYATAQNGSCGVSTNSGNASAVTQTSSARCGSITGPVTAGSTSASGTLSTAVASTTVNLYMDGINIGTTTTSTTSWTITGLASTALYPNGTLTIGIQESGKQEVTCSSSVTVSCSSSPATPLISPTSSAISQNQSVTYTISNAVSGYFYGIADATTGQSLATGVWATSNGNLSITTKSFNSMGTFNPVVKATSLSGLTVCNSSPASASVMVSGTLPVNFLNLYASRTTNGINVTWQVANELNVAYYIVERSFDCSHFESAGQVNYADGNSPKQYSFIDPIQPSSNICYRVKQVDNNGNYHFSSIAIVKAASNLLMQIIPNPASEKAVLMIESSKEETGVLELVDINGKSIQKKTVQLSKGKNSIPFTGPALMIKGVYIVKLSTTSQLRFEKLIIH